MQKLNLPAYDLRLKREDGKEHVFDSFRGKWLILTPEEHVRQIFAHYLVNELNFPISLMAMEYSLRLNKLHRRCDIIVFDRAGNPLLLVECKAPEVKVTQAVFDQISRYNMVFNVNYLVVTNGLQHYCCKVDYENKKVDFLESIPSYDQIKH